MEPLLEVRDLRVRFGDGPRPIRAVDGVDLEVEAGEMVGLVGESGSGKTTLGLSLMGLLPERARVLPGSSIRLRGRETVGLAPGDLRFLRGREVAMVFQDAGASLNPVVPVGRQVVEAIRAQRRVGRGTAWEEAVERLREVGIPAPQDRARRYPHELSGGMRQRVALAMALAGQPSLLVADEPTAALDVTIQAQILDLLEDLRRRRGMAVLLISHDLGVVSQACRRVTVLYGGRVMEEGPVDAALAHPRHPYTKGLLGSLPAQVHRKERLPGIAGVVPPAGEWPPGCPFAPRCPYAWDRCHAETPSLFPEPPRRSDEGGPELRRSRCWLEVEEGQGGPLPDPTARRTAPFPGPLPSESEGGGDPEGQEPLLEVKHLKVHYAANRGLGILRRGGPPVRAVDGVDLVVRKGETYGLVGESGCGKTTLARAILGLIRPTAGRVRLGGGDPQALGRRGRHAFRRKVQIVFQDPVGSLNPRKTVGAALEEVLRVHDLAPETARKRRVADLLERVGLRAGDGERFPHAFSGGQRQRVGIARALAVEPEFLVLDEPVSALDVSIRAQVLNLLLDLQSELGLTYLFIAHDLSVVEHMSDRIGVMYAGRLVEEAPAPHFAEGGWHPYTRALWAAVPALPGAPSQQGSRAAPQGHPDPPWELGAEREGGEKGIGVGGEPPDPTSLPEGCPYRPRCRHPLRDEACREAVPPLEERKPGHRVACPKGEAAVRPTSGASLDSLDEPRHLGFPPEPGSEG